MDQNQSWIEHFKSKYSSELNVPKNGRRKFSANFKADFLAMLEETQLTQAEFCSALGIYSSTATEWRRNLIRSDQTPIK
jgi:transposase-like protein